MDSGREKDNRQIMECPHVAGVGQMAVYVTAGCPKSNMIKGMLVSSRRRCRECRQGRVGTHGK